MENTEMFVPEKDYFETTSDGRQIQIAVKGVPLPLTEARKLGLVTETATEEAEKSVKPEANKAKLPKQNK